jgi:hypothetical protein
MRATTFRRRDFLASSALTTLALAACATGAGSGGLDATSRTGLAQMARRLYPHDALGDEVYAEVSDGVAAAGDPAAIADGLRALDAAGAGRFLDRDAAGQVASLQAIESGAFFAGVRAGVQARLYEHPATWAAIGYPGPALPFGGYWDKGFDDIDWLPNETTHRGDA